MTTLAYDLLIPFVLFIVFIVYQSSEKASERTLTALVLVSIPVIWLFEYNHNEWIVFAAGILLGIFIEVGLQSPGRQQIWKRASFFGVPYWLPLAWGVGFVIITRLGMFVRGW